MALMRIAVLGGGNGSFAAAGMASILSSFLGGRTLMGIWYHFAILFEALFILTTVDAGTFNLAFLPRFAAMSEEEFVEARRACGDDFAAELPSSS